MKAGMASRTAERVAARRAAHQLLDRPIVFEDPLAEAVLFPPLAEALRRDPRRWDRSRVGRYLRAFLAVRSRFAEDQLAVAVGAGVRQYVILGAGLDTFAYRNPYVELGLRVFEVDHPATQAMKRQRLRSANLAPSGDVTFVAVDLGEATLDSALAQTSFDQSAPSFFSWLGVVPYLDLPAIRTTLRFVAGLPGTSTIVFDYGVRPSRFDLLARFVVWRISRRVAAIGEPWKTLFSRATLLGELRDAGFTRIENYGADELNAGYLHQRGDGLRVGKLGHIALASHGPREKTGMSASCPFDALHGR